MSFALQEMRRRPGRFVTATLILTLIAVLLMFLGGLLDGLIAFSTNALRAQQGDLIVYSATGDNSFLRSRISPEVREQVDAVDGVSATGGIGVVQLGARVPGNDARDLADVALFGYELAPRGVPDPPPDGRAYADDTLQAKGVKEGTVLQLGPARTPVTVAGFVSDTSYSGQGSLWASPTTWRRVQNANRPDATVPDGVFGALIVRTTDRSAAAVAATADRIDAATGEQTSALTIETSANTLPGVAEQKSTFNQIIGVTVLIALVVVGLFFALLVVERTSLYGVLKAMGARTRALAGGVVLQGAVVALIASAIGAALTLVLAAAIPPGSLPFQATAARLLTSAAYLLFAAVIGCAFSLRRVLRVDPASAIGSST